MSFARRSPGKLSVGRAVVFLFAMIVEKISRLVRQPQSTVVHAVVGGKKLESLCMLIVADGPNSVEGYSRIFIP